MAIEKEQIIADCLKMEGSFVDNPYGPGVDVVKNKTGKSFALVGILDEKSDKNFIKTNADAGAPVAAGDINITLKCPPEQIFYLREMYKAVVPGYYSNKSHWNTIIINKDCPYNEVKNLIKISYDLVTPTPRRKKQEPK